MIKKLIREIFKEIRLDETYAILVPNNHVFKVVNVELTETFKEYEKSIYNANPNYNTPRKAMSVILEKYFKPELGDYDVIFKLVCSNNEVLGLEKYERRITPRLQYKSEDIFISN